MLLSCRPLRISRSGFGTGKVQGFRISGVGIIGFWDQGLGFLGFWGFGCWGPKGFGVRVYGFGVLGFWMLGAIGFWGQGLWFRGFRVLDVGGYRVLGSGCRVLDFRV